ncbi:glycoside hydrolase family 43 protein [Butyrivibrio sp. YAB3001]|uniref:glycoside hydrolase family 43 protein n=1 Tax=Butyrivibrio sp. YAB3001 TaxID=1520812 RepID=UPI001FA85B34|nr:glycoside hydrolase family 43 protein [Butyrivibrio sp. YAB3001]
MRYSKGAYGLKKRIEILGMITGMALIFSACGFQRESTETEKNESIITESEGDQKEMSEEKMLEKVEVKSSAKGIMDHNPVMVQRFGADPYALVYDGRVYLYMTGDKVSYNPDKTVKENTYGNIDTINVISSDDLVNWTDHGTVYAAGKKGAASWGPNSWAPAAAYKNIDGKDKFFLYFANNGNGIGVLTSDTPYGPYTDPLGKPLISRETPNCAEVTWLFDPAVLMDDDGSAYIYVGGGVPSPDKASNPGTARVAKLGDDMISLDGDPIAIENVDYLFEDSGINKIDGTYYYSYCSNFNVTPEAAKELGFESGEIVTMKSDNPMGPFERCNAVLKNPEAFFGRGGNNHHCMFEFNGEWYITYHSRILEEKMGIDGGYRSTNVDKLLLDENNAPTASKGTRAGVEQLKSVDPYTEIKAVTMSNAAEITTKQYGESAEKSGSGDMILAGIHDGSWTSVSGVDFGEGANSFTFKVRGKGEGTIRVCLDLPSSEPVAVAEVNAPGSDLTEVTAELSEAVTGEHNVYFVYSGENFEVYSWIAE